MKTTVRLFLLLLVTSCAQIRSVSQTSIPAKRSHIVTAEVKNNIFFLFNFRTDYVNDLTKQLRDKCENGRVEGILTKDVIITYFPIVYYKEHITAEGYCVK